MSSVTDGYQWDKSGSLTSVNVTLAGKTGSVSNPISADKGYIHGSQITSDPLRHAYVMAHELAHVEYAQTPAGASSLQQDQKDSQRLQQLEKQLGPAGSGTALIRRPLMLSLKPEKRPSTVKVFQGNRAEDRRRVHIVPGIRSGEGSAGEGHR